MTCRRWQNQTEHLRILHNTEKTDLVSVFFQRLAALTFYKYGVAFKIFSVGIRRGIHSFINILKDYHEKQFNGRI